MLDSRTLLANADILNSLARTAISIRCVVSRDSGKLVTHFGRQGDYAGQFNHLHVIAVDSMGNVYTGEAGARRVQKLRVVERQRCK